MIELCLRPPDLMLISTMLAAGEAFPTAGFPGAILDLDHGAIIPCLFYSLRFPTSALFAFVADVFCLATCAMRRDAGAGIRQRRTQASYWSCLLCQRLLLVLREKVASVALIQGK
jgi:hypothetical protein